MARGGRRAGSRLSPGDVIGYGLVRLLNGKALEHRAIGLAARRRDARVQSLHGVTIGRIR